MKNFYALILPVFLLLIATEKSFAQQRSHAAGHFELTLGGNKAGWLKPVKKGDTLIYTINKLSDTTLLRRKFDSAFNKPVKKYYLKYKLKKKP